MGYRHNKINNLKDAFVPATLPPIDCTLCSTKRLETYMFDSNRFKRLSDNNFYAYVYANKISYYRNPDSLLSLSKSSNKLAESINNMKKYIAPLSEQYYIDQSLSTICREYKYKE